MAVQTYRLVNNTATGSNFGRLDTADQAAATAGGGWIVAKGAAGLSAELAGMVSEVTAGSFSSNTTTPKPLTPNNTIGNGFRSQSLISGTFANTAWSIVVAWRSVTAAHTGTVRIRVRVFRSVNADGSGATELTGATQVGTTSGAGSTSADVSSTVTWTPGSTLTFTNEYLFIIVALEIVTASGSNSADADLRTGTSTTGTRIVTSDLTLVYTDADTATLGLTPSGSDVAQYLEAQTAPLGLTPSVGETYTTIDVEQVEFNWRAPDSLVSFTNSLSDGYPYYIQSFTMPAAGILETLKLPLVKQGSPTDNYVIEVRANNPTGGDHPGAVLASWTLDPSTLGTSMSAAFASPTVFTASDFAQLPSGKNWIVIHRTGATSVVNYMMIANYSSSAYSGGAAGSWDGAIDAPASNPDYNFYVTYLVEAKQLKLALTPSGSDVYTPGVVEYTDAAIETLALTPSGADVLQAVEAQTAVVTLAPSVVEITEFVDAATVGLTLAPTTPQEGREWWEAVRQIASRFTSAVSGGENISSVAPSSSVQDLVLSSVGQLISLKVAAHKNGSPTDSLRIAIHADDGTNLRPAQTPLVYWDILGSTLPTYPEGARDNPIFLTPSESITLPSGRVWIVYRRTGSTDGANYYTTIRTDANYYTSGASGTWNGSPSSAANNNQFDHPFQLVYAPTTDIVAVTLSPSGSDVYTPPSGVETTDAATEILALTASASDIAAFVDASDVPVGFSPSGVDVQERIFLDSATLTAVLTPSASEIMEMTDAASDYLALSAISSDVSAFSDSSISALNTIPSGTDVLLNLGDFDTEPLALTASATFVHGFADSSLAPVGLAPSGADALTGTDSAIETLTTQPSGAEIREILDDATITLGLVALAEELYGRQLLDGGTMALSLFANAVDVLDVVDTGDILVLFDPSGAEALSGLMADSGLTYLKLTGAAGVGLIDLIGFLRKRAYSATVPFRRYWTQARRGYA